MPDRFSRTYLWENRSSRRTDELNNAELVEGVRRGDDTVFVELYQQYYEKTRNWCLSELAGDFHAADDCAAEVFAHVATTRLHGLKDPESLPGWLKAVARRTARRHLGKSREVATPQKDTRCDQPTPAELTDRLGPDLVVLLKQAHALLGGAQQDMYVDALRIAFGDADRTQVATERGISRPVLTVKLHRTHQQLQYAIRVITLPDQQWSDCTELKATKRKHQKIVEHIKFCAFCKQASDRALITAGVLVALPFLFLPIPFLAEIPPVTRVSFRGALPLRSLAVAGVLAVLALIGWHQWQPGPTTLVAPQTTQLTSTTSPAAVTNTPPATNPAARRATSARPSPSAPPPSTTPSSSKPPFSEQPLAAPPSSARVSAAAVSAPPPTDKAGPVITNVTRNGEELAQCNGKVACGGAQTTLTVSAQVTDASDVSQIVLTGTVHGQSRTWSMLPNGKATISYDLAHYRGPTSKLTLSITAMDSLGNTTTASAGQVLLYSCTPG